MRTHRAIIYDAFSVLWNQLDAKTTSSPNRIDDGLLPCFMSAEQKRRQSSNFVIVEVSCPSRVCNRATCSVISHFQKKCSEQCSEHIGHELMEKSFHLTAHFAKTFGLCGVRRYLNNSISNILRSANSSRSAEPRAHALQLACWRIQYLSLRAVVHMSPWMRCVVHLKLRFRAL